jgi:hypothetical protein
MGSFYTAADVEIIPGIIPEITIHVGYHQLGQEGFRDRL